jgi:VanZ family protein
MSLPVRGGDRKGQKGKVVLHFLFYWLPPFALMSLVFYLSSLSSLPDFQTYDFTVKKLAHLCVYALLYFLLFRAFHANRPHNALSRCRTYLYPAIVTFLFAVSDEIHQSYVPFRSPAVRDVAIDSAGIFLMYCAIRKGPAFFARFLRKASPYSQ